MKNIHQSLQNKRGSKERERKTKSRILVFVLSGMGDTLGSLYDETIECGIVASVNHPKTSYCQKSVYFQM